MSHLHPSKRLKPRSALMAALFHRQRSCIYRTTFLPYTPFKSYYPTSSPQPAITEIIVVQRHFVLHQRLWRWRREARLCFYRSYQAKISEYNQPKKLWHYRVKPISFSIDGIRSESASNHQFFTQPNKLSHKWKSITGYLEMISYKRCLQVKLWTRVWLFTKVYDILEDDSDYNHRFYSM